MTRLLMALTALTPSTVLLGCISPDPAPKFYDQSGQPYTVAVTEIVFYGVSDAEFGDSEIEVHTIDSDSGEWLGGRVPGRRDRDSVPSFSLSTGPHSRERAFSIRERLEVGRDGEDAASIDEFCAALKPRKLRPSGLSFFVRGEGLEPSRPLGH